MPAVCSVCGGAAARRLYCLPRHSIFACERCGQVFLSRLPRVQGIRQPYTTGESPFAGTPELRRVLLPRLAVEPLVQPQEKWLDALERYHRPGTLLDIGCGTGSLCWSRAGAVGDGRGR